MHKYEAGHRLNAYLKCLSTQTLWRIFMSSQNLLSKIFFVIGFVAITNQAQAKTHVIQKGETLASIARAYFGEPVFGPKGSLNKIYKMNPWAKNNPSLVEPGQIVILDKEPQLPKAAAVVEASKGKPEVIVEDLTIKAVPEKIPPITTEATTVEMPIEPVANLTPASSPAIFESEIHQNKNHFYVIPYLSQIKHTASNDTSGLSYSLSSSSAYGLEAGWDHWWNESFATILSVSTVQLKTTAVSELTGLNILESATLNQGELLLMNKVHPKLRIGLGIAQGNHLFLEDFSSSPADPRIYRSTSLGGLAAIHFKFFEGTHFRLIAELKAAFWPPKIIQGHDLKTGTEYFGQLFLIQKLRSWEMLYGMSSSTNNQSRSDGTETRTETAFKLGFIF
jgi:hypothetical protein